MIKAKKYYPGMTKKYVALGRTDIYSVCYPDENVMYYNVDFNSTTQIFILKRKNEANIQRYVR